VTSREEQAEVLRQIFNAETKTLAELVKVAGLDPRRDFRYADWRHVDFGDADLRGYDFSGADVTGAIFSRATGLVGPDRAIFDSAVGLQAARWPHGYDHTPSRLQPGAVWRDQIPGIDLPDCPPMVTLPTGRFMMGSPAGEEGRYGDEDPLHEVAIAHRLAIGRGPVTFAQWDAAVADGAKLKAPSDEGWGRGDLPVINVSWKEAKGYVAWLNGKLGLRRRRDAYRLPSEAEWEYACRAETTTPFSFGETISTGQANYNAKRAYGQGDTSGVYLERTSPVGSYPPNAFGLYDMHGNVLEWCEDVWHDNYEGAPKDGSAWLTGDTSRRVLRGGSWLSDPDNCRSACRLRSDPTDRNYDIGFRLARTLSPPPS
jgi:formylglycine-generating enzyme required for sulfatase activity